MKTYSEEKQNSYKGVLEVAKRRILKNIIVTIINLLLVYTF